MPAFISIPDPPRDDDAFVFHDCALVVRMGGVPSAMNLRELHERVRVCPADCLAHHFCETLVRPTFDDTDFRNDFAIWARSNLEDRVLAERLGMIDPYSLPDLEALRERLLEVLDERLSEVSMIPWARPGGEFHFLRGVMTVFGSDLVARTPEEFRAALPALPPTSIYHHFVAARRRTQDGSDDFTAWLRRLPEPREDYVEALARIDFSFFRLVELRRLILEALAPLEPALLEVAR